MPRPKSRSTSSFAVSAPWYRRWIEHPDIRIIGMVVGWVLLTTLFALLAWHRVNVTIDTAYGWIDPHHLHAPSWKLLDLPARWDSEWYLDIAKNGYSMNGWSGLANIVFFPVYPMLMRCIGWILGGNFILAGWLISLVSLIAGCVVLGRLVHEFHPKADADEVIAAFLFFPLAIFFAAVYTESIFFLLSVSCVYFARKGNFLLASLIGMAAALTRVTGALLFLPVLIEVFLKYGFGMFRRWEGYVVGLIPAGTIAFFSYHWLVFGSPWLFFQIEKNWGRSFELNLQHFVFTTPASMVNQGMDIFFFAIGFILSYLVARHARPLAFVNDRCSTERSGLLIVISNQVTPTHRFDTHGAKLNSTPRA
jgi:hypothetical protein